MSDFKPNPSTESVISSSESDTESDVEKVVKKCPVVSKELNTANTSVKAETFKMTKKAQQETSSESSDDEEVQRKETATKNMDVSDFEAKRRAAANAEAERQLEELLTKVDAQTKARRRRRKREKQKRRRRNNADGSHEKDDEVVNSFDDQFYAANVGEPEKGKVRNEPDGIHIGGELKDVPAADSVNYDNQLLDVPESGLIHAPNKADCDRNERETLLNGDVSHADDSSYTVCSHPSVSGFDDLRSKHGKAYKKGKNKKKDQFYTMTKEEQLNSSYENRSHIYENSNEVDVPEERKFEPKVLPEPKDYSKYELLGSLPKAGNKIAYKVLELSDVYTPEISAYKECEILVADVLTSTLVVKLILQSEEKSVGKFDIVDEEYDTTGPKSDEVISLAWASLIEPRLIV